jgi:adenosyl cobinamide kinase/adenosyl cobinamide phosphate guanylyltransferase
MAFKLKKRGIDDAKKILVYGNDGTGKSTFAAEYCKEHGLNPIVIDVDDTNYTDCDILDLTLTNDIKTFNAIKEAIQHIGKSDYDTIILDGVSSLIEMLVSKDPGIKKYEVRNDRFKQILKAIRASGKNIIFIGQADMRVVCNDDYQSNKLIIKVNSIVNEKYHCLIDADGKYGYEVEKFREATAKPVDETPLPPKPQKVEAPKLQEMVEKLNPLDNAAEIASSIIAELPKKSLVKAYEELIRLNKNGFVTDDECPAIKQEIERLLS